MWLLWGSFKREGVDQVGHNEVRFYHNVKQTVSNICATISGWHSGRRRFSEEGAGAAAVAASRRDGRDRGRDDGTSGSERIRPPVAIDHSPTMRSVPGGGWKNSEGKKKVWRADGWFAEYSAASPKYQMREKSPG